MKYITLEKLDHMFFLSDRIIVWCVYCVSHVSLMQKPTATLLNHPRAWRAEPHPDVDWWIRGSKVMSVTYIKKKKRKKEIPQNARSLQYNHAAGFFLLVN